MNDRPALSLIDASLSGVLALSCAVMLGVAEVSLWSADTAALAPYGALLSLAGLTVKQMVGTSRRGSTEPETETETERGPAVVMLDPSDETRGYLMDHGGKVRRVAVRRYETYPGAVDVREGSADG
jgi:hypothetical protein